MNRHGAYPNGHAGSRRKDDDDRYDPESRYSPWIANSEDIIDDDKDIFDHKWKGNRHPQSNRRRLFRNLGLVLAAICLLLWWFTPADSVRWSNDNGYANELDEIETVRYYDLDDVQGTKRGWDREERVLLCTPLRDASQHLDMFFGHLRNLTYPHHLIDLAFLVSDSKDDTEENLQSHLEALQNDPEQNMAYGEISIIHKDFGQAVGQDVESRHGFAAQAPRRKLMARARNWLLSAALRPTHSWVYWRDADVETCPFTVLEDLMAHDKDVIVPSEYPPPPQKKMHTDSTRCLAATARLARRRTAIRLELVAGIRHCPRSG